MNSIKYCTGDYTIKSCLRQHNKDINFIEIDNDFEFIIEEYLKECLVPRRSDIFEILNKNFIRESELEIYIERKYNIKNIRNV